MNETQSIQVGGQFDNFTYQTAWEQGKKLYDQLGGGKTFLIFSRYIGCHPCLMELIGLAGRYPRLREAGGNVVVIMQSDPAVVRGLLEAGVAYRSDGTDHTFGREELPYDLICDPDRTLYKTYGIKPAKNKQELATPAAMEKAKKAVEMGLKHGKYEGDELQLPATFLLDAQGTVLHAHYGNSFADYLSEREMLDLLK